MRKATLVLATSVAFLLFGSAQSYAGIKKNVPMPSAKSVIESGGTTAKAGGKITASAPLQGEYIPASSGTRTTPIKVLPKLDFSIPRTINASKTLLRGTVAQLVIGGAIYALLDGIDAVQDGSTIKFKRDEVVTVVGTGDIHWTFSGGSGGARFATPDAACALYDGTPWGTSGTNILVSITRTSDTSQTCVTRNRYANGTITSVTNVPVYRHGTTCPEGATYNPAKYACTLPSGYATGTDSDFDKIDDFVESQTSDFIRDLIKETCQGSISPNNCYESLKDSEFLEGPTDVSGPSTFTTTTGPLGTTTKETKTNYQITYGSNYFTYAPVTTTVTVNPDGTTEVETEEPAPDEEQEEEVDTTLGDPYAPVVDQYTQIGKDLGKDEAPVTFITYGPWYSFGGTCAPVTLELPVMGSYFIDHCYYVETWIRPTLAFLFAVYTWLHCFALWRETIHKARPI